MNNEKTITEPFRECPRFTKCNVNNCPLSSQYPNLITDPEDLEPKCTMERRVRERIGSEFPNILPYKGMTRREYSAGERWANMSQEARDKILEAAKKFHFKPDVKKED